MPFTFDTQTQPRLEHGRPSVRFWMVDGDERASCQIAFATLSDLGPGEADNVEDMLERFENFRQPITAAAARLLARGAHAGGGIVQLLRENLR